MKKHLLLVLIMTFLSIYGLRSQVTQLDSGLVAFYPFNGNANDESGNGNNGAIVGAVLSEDRFGIENSAFWFNGDSSFIKVPDNDILDIVSEISICGWIKKDSNVIWASMVTKGGEIGIENNYALHNDSIGSVIFTSYNWMGTGGGECNGSIVIPNNEWHFVAFSWDGFLSKIYIDDNLDIASVTELTGEFLPNMSSMYIGADLPWGVEYFAGYLDDIRIYNRWLTVEEILELYEENPSGINAVSPLISKLKIFPNPVESSTSVNFYNPDGSIYRLLVINLSGIKVLEIENITSDKALISVGNLQPGLYIVELRGKRNYRGKMMVK